MLEVESARVRGDGGTAAGSAQAWEDSAGSEEATVEESPWQERAAGAGWVEGRCHSGIGPRDWRRGVTAAAKQLRIVLVHG